MRRIVFLGCLAALAVLFAGVGCSSKDGTKAPGPESPTPVVVLYCAQDQIFAEPVLKEFRKQTGIEVKAVFDSEAVKTVGLANRLVAEKSRPQCDVFWGNEELRTRQLEAEGVFVSPNGWKSFGFRTRRLVINTNRMSVAAAPKSLLEITNAAWKGKIAIAYPMFGTTSAHFLALKQTWGEPGWLAWCRALQANRPLVLDGNSMVVKMVGRGEAVMGLTDSDDIASGVRSGLPIAGVAIHETLFIPNTVGLVRGGPNPAYARQLFDYLRRPEVVKGLIAINALEGAKTYDSKEPFPNWAKLLEDLPRDNEVLKGIFLREGIPP